MHAHDVTAHEPDEPERRGELHGGEQLAAVPHRRGRVDQQAHREVVLGFEQDTIIVTSKTTKTEFQAITSKPIEVITNGYDVEKIGKQVLDEKFTLAHIGSFLSERNPTILWQALQELVAENTDFKNDFRLKLIGASSQEVLDTIASFQLNDYVQNFGYVSHQEAIEHQRKSQVLLLIEINSEETKSIIPGKLFEYMVSERPIIAIGPKGSDFAEIITSTNTGVFFTYDEKEKLKALLLKYYQQYKTQNLKVQAVGLQQYSRKSLTKQLAKLIVTLSAVEGHNS